MENVQVPTNLMDGIVCNTCQNCSRFEVQTLVSAVLSKLCSKVKKIPTSLPVWRMFLSVNKLGVTSFEAGS